MHSLALPGIVDIHVHLRGLKLSYKEDERSGTMAAASGCVTMVADMPNTMPELRTSEAVKEKLASLGSMALVDYSLYAGVPRSVGEAMEIASLPIAGFKIYPEDLKHVDRVEAVLEAAEESGLLVVLHPEVEDLFLSVDNGWNRGFYRQCAAEAAAVDELNRVSVSRGFKSRIHVTHVSCPETVKHAKSKGFTVDVTPHHLFIDDGAVLPYTHAWGKVNPPLRGVHERALLLANTLEGSIDAIASDHAPHSPWEKWMPPQTAPPGFPWLEWWPGFTALRLLEHLGVGRFYTLTSHSPLRILGFEGRKRCLHEGCEATISVLMIDRTRVYHKGYTKAPYMPALGMESYDCLATVIRGSPVYTLWGGVSGGFKGRLQPIHRDQDSRDRN